MSNRKSIEAAAREIAHAAKVLKPDGSAFCVLLWGHDERGSQWRTYVHDTAPATGQNDLRSRRRKLAEELRTMADTIENTADLPPGVAGRG